MQLLSPTPSRLTPRSPADAISPTTAVGRRNFPNVLLVDDDSAVREGLRRVLTGEALHVTTAAGGDEAMRAIELHEPDLLITDLCMAASDGWDLLVRENRLRPSLPIFVISALPARETCGADQAATEFFQKPLNLDALIAAIHRHLGVAPQT